MERNKCKSFLKRFLCLALALVVSMTSTSLDVLAGTGGGAGGGSFTGTHVSNYIGKGIMGYRMYLVKNSHKDIAKGQKTRKGVRKVLGASNYLLKYNKKNTKKPYKLIANKKYYTSAKNNIASKIFYSFGDKKNISSLKTGITKERKIGKTGSLMKSVMTKLEDNKVVRKRNEKVSISYNFEGLGDWGSVNLDFSSDNAKKVFGVGANISFTNYSMGRGMTATFSNSGNNDTKPIGDTQRAVVPAAEIKFLVKTFNKLISSGSNEHSNDVKYEIIRQMLSKTKVDGSTALKKAKDKIDEGDKCKKLRTYLLNHYTIVIEPVVTLMRDDKKLTISYQDYKRYPARIDKKFFMGNQLKAIVGNMGLYGTIEIANRKKDIQNAYETGKATEAISSDKYSPYGYGIYRGCADIGMDDPSETGVELTKTVIPEITVSASVSTIGRSINTVGSYDNVGKDTQSTQYLMLKMHRVDFMDLGWKSEDGSEGHSIVNIVDEGNFVSIIPLDQLDDVSKLVSTSATSNDIASVNSEWKVSEVLGDADLDEDDKQAVQGVVKDTNFFALCDGLTKECLKAGGRVYNNSAKYATVGFNTPTTLCEVDTNQIGVTLIKDGRNTNITSECQDVLGSFNKNLMSTTFLDNRTVSLNRLNGDTIKVSNVDKVNENVSSVYALDEGTPVAFNDITDAYTGVYLGFGTATSGTEQKGNANKANLQPFMYAEANKMLYNLNDYWNEKEPLIKENTLYRHIAEANNFFNRSLALDRYINIDDVPSNVDTTIWCPSHIGSSLRDLFAYSNESGISSHLSGYQAKLDDVGTVLYYDSITDYDYAQETAFTAKFTSISTLIGALRSDSFKNAYSIDGISWGIKPNYSNIGVCYSYADPNYVVGANGNTNTRSKTAQASLGDYVDSDNYYSEAYRCSNLSELADTNTASSCEDAVLRVSQSNASDVSINLHDTYTYVAEIEGGGTAGDYNNNDDVFGYGDAVDTSAVQPYYIKLDISQTSARCVNSQTVPYVYDSGAHKGELSHYVHTCNWEENGVTKQVHNAENIANCNKTEYININLTYTLYDNGGVIKKNNSPVTFPSHIESSIGIPAIKQKIKGYVNSDTYGNIELDTIDKNDVSLKANFNNKGKAVSQTIYIAIHNDKKEKYVATFFNSADDAKKKLDQTEAIDNADAEEEFEDEDTTLNDDNDANEGEETMGTDDASNDVEILDADSFINPDAQRYENGFNKVTEIHSNAYYEKMANGGNAGSTTVADGSTGNKRIATRVSIYDKLYMYDENITDDINYLVFDYDGTKNARYTYNSAMSIVDKIEVTKSLSSAYMHTYSTSELPSKNLNEEMQNKVNNVIKGEGMKLEYIFAVPRVLTKKLDGSKQWVENTCNIPALVKKTTSTVRRNIDNVTSNTYAYRSDIIKNFMKNLSNSDFGISDYSASPYFNSETDTVASKVFTVGTWVGSGNFDYNKRNVALTSGQLKGYSIYYIYSKIKTDDKDINPRLKSVDGTVTLKEYELNRVYDSIQNLTELHDNPMVFRKQVNFADVQFSPSVNKFIVDVYDVKGTVNNVLVLSTSDSGGSRETECIISDGHSGILKDEYKSQSGIDSSSGAVDALNTSYKVIDSSTGTLTTANFDSSIADLTTNGFNSLNLVKGNKYVLQTVNWFKQGTLRDGVNINSAIPFVPDYSINVSRHFFGDKRVLSAITSCAENSTNQKWLTTLLGLSIGIKPTNRNFDVNMGMNNTTVSETVKLGDGTFGKKCSDAFRLTAGWFEGSNDDTGLNDNTDLKAKEKNRVVEILSAYHYDYNFILRSNETKPSSLIKVGSATDVSAPNGIGKLLTDTSSNKEDKDNLNSALRFIEYFDVARDGSGSSADIFHRHDYHLAQLGNPAGTIFHSGGEDNTTYSGVVLNIREYAFRYNTIYQGSKFAKNTETPKNGILEFANKTGAKLDGVEISSGSKVTNHKLGNLNGYAYGYVNNDAKRGSVDIRMKFYPEVEMLAYAYNNSMYEYGAVDKSLYNINRIPSSIPANKDAIYGLDSSCIANIDASQLQGWKTYMKLLTIGEELRKANTSELYVLSVKKGRKEGSFVDSDIKGKIASDGLAAGVGDAVSVGSGVGDLPTIYAGSDVVLQADSDFTINMAGYALDLIDDGDTSIIDDDDTPIYEETDASGNKSLKTHSYKEIVSSGEDIYTKWGNQTVGGRNRDNLFNNFTDWVENNAVNEKFKVDAKLKVSNNVYSNFNISVGSVEPLTASDKRESISNNSYNVNAYTKKEYATGAYDIIKGKGILDKFASNKNTAETGCYQIKVSHGKIEKDDGGYIAMIKQLAVDYDFAEDYWSVDDEAYKKAEKIFEASGIYSSIFEAIESDNDESNKSCRVATYERDEDGNPVKKDDKLVYKEDCYDERGNNIGVDVSNEDILGNGEHWYDERVYTMVIRRFESRPFYLKDITLSDKVDYANATTNTKIHSQLKDANVGKWYFTVYLGERDKSNTPFADYRETNNNYCGEGKIFPEISFFNPEANNRESSLNNAKSSGTVIMEDVWVDGADFRVPDATTGDMTAY